MSCSVERERERREGGRVMSERREVRGAESGERFLPVQSSYAQGRRLAESDLYIYMSPEESNDEMLGKKEC